MQTLPTTGTDPLHRDQPEHDVGLPPRTAGRYPADRPAVDAGRVLELHARVEQARDAGREPDLRDLWGEAAPSVWAIAQREALRAARGPGRANERALQRVVRDVQRIGGRRDTLAQRAGINDRAVEAVAIMGGLLVLGLTAGALIGLAKLISWWWVA